MRKKHRIAPERSAYDPAAPRSEDQSLWRAGFDICRFALSPMVERFRPQVAHYRRFIDRVLEAHAEFLIEDANIAERTRIASLTRELGEIYSEAFRRGDPSHGREKIDFLAKNMLFRIQPEEVGKLYLSAVDFEKHTETSGEHRGGQELACHRIGQLIGMSKVRVFKIRQDVKKLGAVGVEAVEGIDIVHYGLLEDGIAMHWFNREPTSSN